MQPELLIALLAGLGGMLGWGFADFFAKKTIDRVGSIVSLVWAHVFGTLALASVALYQQFVLGQQLNIPNDISVWAGLLFFGALQAVVYLLAYQGFGKGLLAVLNPVFASYSGLVAVISIVVFREAVNIYLLIAIAIIFSGVLLLSIDTQGLRSKRLNIFGIPGLKEVGLAALLAAFWTVGWDKFVGGRDWVTYALLMYAFMTLTAFLISRAQKVKLKVTNPGLWKFLVLIGLCEIVAYLAISLGFSVTGFTSIVAVLSGAFSLPTILLARIFLKEKVNTLQTVGSLVILVGIIALSLS